MGAGFEGLEFVFDEGQDFLHVGPLWLPGEMEGEGVALVAGA